MAPYGVGPGNAQEAELICYRFSGSLTTSATFSTAFDAFPRKPEGGDGTGTVSGWLERGGIKELVVAVYANRNSATTALRVDQSVNGSAVHGTSWEVTYSSGTLTEQIVQLSAPYFRFSYTTDAALASDVNISVTGR